MHEDDLQGRARPCAKVPVMVIDQLRVLAIVQWNEEGRWPLYRLLAQRVKQMDCLSPRDFQSSRTSFRNRLLSLGANFYLPFVAFKRRRNYDVVLVWTQRMGVLCGLLNRLFGKGPSPRYILNDFHLNPIRKDLFYLLRLKLVKLTLSGIDFFLCTSTTEEKVYSDLFHIPPEKIRFFPLSCHPDFLQYNVNNPERDYIFSFGNSDRDFDSLIEASEGLPIKVVILSQNYNRRRTVPPNVVLIRDKIEYDEVIRFIASSRFVVLPLQAYGIACGQLSMLETMTLGRPLIISANVATIEYATHPSTVLFYEAGNVPMLRGHMEYLLENKEHAEEMGQRARELCRPSYEKRFSVLMNVLDVLSAR